MAFGFKNKYPAESPIAVPASRSNGGSSITSKPDPTSLMVQSPAGRSRLARPTGASTSAWVPVVAGKKTYPLVPSCPVAGSRKVAAKRARFHLDRNPENLNAKISVPFESGYNPGGYGAGGIRTHHHHAESATCRFYVPRNATNATATKAACPTLPDGIDLIA